MKLIIAAVLAGLFGLGIFLLLKSNPERALEVGIVILVGLVLWLDRRTIGEAWDSIMGWRPSKKD